MAEEIPAGAGAQAPQDWRLRFVTQRYAKLLEILSRRMGEEALSEVLTELGGYCSSLDDKSILSHRGDLPGYADFIRKSASGDTVTFDHKAGVITMASPERKECFCPLVSVSGGTPKAACACSLGWHGHTWKTLLEKDVKVDLMESVLRGGTRCVFRIKVDGRL